MENAVVFMGIMSLLLMIHQLLGELRNKKKIKELESLNARQMAFIKER